MNRITPRQVWSNVTGSYHNEADVLPVDDHQAAGSDDRTRLCRNCGEVYDASRWHFCRKGVE